MANELENILKDKTLTKEQKVQIINQYYDNYRAEIDKELNNYLAKQYIGAALEIGSVALPFGGVGKLGGEIGKQILKKQLGRKISENIGSGILTGGTRGGLFGFGDSLINETNPILSTLQGALLGTTAGAALGAAGGNIQKTFKGQQLKNYGNIDNLDDILRKQYNNDSRKFYQDYIQEIQLNKNGNFDFSKRGVQEQMRWNPHQAQNFSELVNDLKNAKRLPDVSNEKPLEKPLVSHYEVYRGKNGDHYIEVLKDGSKRFYITKDTYIGTPHAASTGSNAGIRTYLESPNNIIPFVNPNYNTQNDNNLLYGSVEMNANNNQQSGLFGYTNPLTGSNHIYTREEVGSMTTDEYSQNEKEIHAQLNKIGIPTNGDLQREAMTGGGVLYVNSYTRSDGTEVRGYYRSRPKF